MKVTTLLLVVAMLVTINSTDSLAQRAVSDSTKARVLYETGKFFRDAGEPSLARTMFKLLRDTYPGSRNAILLRGQHRAAPTIPAGELDHSGRVSYVVGGSIYGMWTGVAIPIIFESESPQAYALGLMAGGPLGLLYTLNYSRHRPMSDGRASIINFGGSWGTWQGVCLGALADLKGNETVGVMLLSGLVGIGVTTSATANRDISAGDATLISFGGAWGTWFGLVGGIIADVEEDGMWTTLIVTGNAGVATGGAIARRTEMSKGRARLINIAGVAGTLFGFGIDMLIEVHSEDTAFLIAGAGSVVGLWAGASATRDYDQRHGSLDGPDGLLGYRGGRIEVGAPSLSMAISRDPSRYAPEAYRYQRQVKLSLAEVRF